MQNNYIKVLHDWGCDIDGALERLCGDSELYVKCLFMFKDDEGFSQLENDMNEKDYRAAYEPAHMLKGVAANLGLTPVVKDISALVEVLRAEEYEKADDMYEKMRDSYLMYCEKIEN